MQVLVGVRGTYAVGFLTCSESLPAHYRLSVSVLLVRCSLLLLPLQPFILKPLIRLLPNGWGI